MIFEEYFNFLKSQKKIRQLEKENKELKEKYEKLFEMELSLDKWIKKNAKGLYEDIQDHLICLSSNNDKTRAIMISIRDWLANKKWIKDCSDRIDQDIQSTNEAIEIMKKDKKKKYSKYDSAENKPDYPARF